MLLFALGALLPAYTITGFDASAHASEETIAAAHSVPRGIVRSVVVSGVAGWVFLSAVVLAAPSVAEAASRGEGAFLWILSQVVPMASGHKSHRGDHRGPVPLRPGHGDVGVTDGLRVRPRWRSALFPGRAVGLPAPASPAVGIWTVSTAAVLFTLYTPLYSTITAVCTILLYISYALPTALGARAHGRTWTTMGPWHLGAWFRPLAWASVAGCLALIAIGVQPPNERAIWVVGGMAVVLALVWIGGARSRFPGPPHLITIGSGDAKGFTSHPEPRQFL